MGFSNRKRGFTLVETVVSVGIVAALAAVVYPAVVKQFDTADPTRVTEDLSNIKTGIETFGVNVRPNQPNDIEDLANVVNTTTDLAARGGTYSASDSANWKGPYITLAVPSAAAVNDTALSTGFSAVIPNRLTLFDTDGPNAATGGDTVATASVANAEFLTIRILGLTGAAFNAINLMIDGPGEVSAAQRRQQGRFRCPLDITPTDTEACAVAFYFAVSTR